MDDLVLVQGRKAKREQVQRRSEVLLRARHTGRQRSFSTFSEGVLAKTYFYSWSQCGPWTGQLHRLEWHPPQDEHRRRRDQLRVPRPNLLQQGAQRAGR